MISLSLPRSRNTWGWSNGGLAPTHMNSCEPISMTETPASLWKCGTTWSDIIFHLEWQRSRANEHAAAASKCRAPYWRVLLIPSAPAAHMLMQIRHNLVVPEKPFFRRGRCVLKAAHHVEAKRKHRVFGMKRLADRLGLGGYGGVRGRLRAAVAACARCRRICWRRRTIRPRSPIFRLNSALRNNPRLIQQNIEAALAADDADLAGSFVELAKAKNVALSDDLSRRVSDAVARGEFDRRISPAALLPGS